MLILRWLRRREVFGSCNGVTGQNSRIYSSLYSSISPFSTKSYGSSGGIFNLEFNSDG